jgi:YcaO-like protein with predicted kinase domain
VNLHELTPWYLANLKGVFYYMDVHKTKEVYLKNLAQPGDYLPISNMTYRSTSLNSTIRRILSFRSHFGITRISDITELDILGLPVVSVIRPGVDPAQITATQGKGLTIKSALASALMEAAERTAASSFKKITTDTAENLIKKNMRLLTPQMLGGEANNEAYLDWVKGTELYSQQDIYIPAADVMFPYYPTKNAIRPFKPSTTGLAAGNTYLEAILSSINEVVERQATSKFLRTLTAHLLDVNTVSCTIINKLLEKFRKANVDVLIVDLSYSSPLPVYYVSVLSNDARGIGITCAGQAAHLIPELALRRALLEAAQSRAVAIQGSREDLIRHATDWQKSFEHYKEKREQLKRHIEENFGFIPMSPVVNLTHNSSYDLTKKTLDRLSAHSYKKIIVSDLTEGSVKIPVTHVIIPGMRDTIIEPKRKPHQISKIDSILVEAIN